MAKCHELRNELLPHPPLSPDLAVGGFFLFSNMNKRMRLLLKRTNCFFSSTPITYYTARVFNTNNLMNIDRSQIRFSYLYNY